MCLHEGMNSTYVLFEIRWTNPPCSSGHQVWGDKGRRTDKPVGDYVWMGRCRGWRGGVGGSDKRLQTHLRARVICVAVACELSYRIYHIIVVIILSTKIRVQSRTAFRTFTTSCCTGLWSPLVLSPFCKDHRERATVFLNNSCYHRTPVRNRIFVDISCRCRSTNRPTTETRYRFTTPTKNS